MSNVSIFEKKWLDLVFEGKNQEYGAYKLRIESSRTTLFAFFFGISFLVGGTLLLSSFTVKPDPIPVDPFDGKIIKVDAWNPPVENPKTELPKVKSNPVDVPKDNKNYVVTKTELAQPDVPKTTEHLTNPITSIPAGSGNGIPTEGQSAGGGSVIPSTVIDNKIKSTKELDRQPLFPGGLKSFYEYVGTNFDRQEMEEGETVRVLVSFVIEKNGVMTDIEVTQKTTPTIDKEAIRVLKSLKTKWAPGYKDGEPVRTQYTLPIAVRSE